MGFSVPPGMTLEQMLRVMAVTEPAVTGEAPTEVAVVIDPEPKPRKRARDASGRLKGDDPTTPQDEAWEAES